jgi:hypothetical protein
MWWRKAAVGAFGAFVISGPAQQFEVVPQTAIGDASKAVVEATVGVLVSDAHARRGPGPRKTPKGVSIGGTTGGTTGGSTGGTGGSTGAGGSTAAGGTTGGSTGGGSSIGGGCR